MNTRYIGIIVLVLVLAAGAVIWGRNTAKTGSVACTQEAKLCPDGSSVGRTGPQCEFAACPETATTSTPGTSMVRPGGQMAMMSIAKIGETITTSQGVKVKPVAVVEDSRCPLDVKCIQAGTVRLRVEIGGILTSGTSVLTLGDTAVVQGWNITLVRVEPDKEAAKSIAAGDYSFSFTITQNSSVPDGKR